MNQLYLYIVIIIFILFLMYVYKKKCDEDYYLSIIQFTQKQYQNNCRPQILYKYISEPIPYQYYSIPNHQNYFQNYNKIKDNDGYKTPKRKKTFQIYKDFSSPSSSPTVNFTNNQFIREKIVLNNLRKDEIYNYYGNNGFEQNNFKGNINKKVFKLEDFLTDSKMKNSCDSNDEFF